MADPSWTEVPNVASSVFFILAILLFSKQTSAKKGNLYILLHLLIVVMDVWVC